MSEPVNKLLSERERKIAKINKLAKDQEQSHLGGFPCPCTSGKPPCEIRSKEPSTPEAEKSSAIWLRRYPDLHSVAEHGRRSRIAVLEEFPHYEPAEQWHDFESTVSAVTSIDQEV